MTQRIVLADSGHVDTAMAIPWLSQQYTADVVTVAVDVGQDRSLDQARACALANGAVRAHVLDARAEFAHGSLLPALRAGSLADGGVDVAASLARTVVARKLIEIAQIEHTDAIACGGPYGDDIERAILALQPAMRVLAVPAAPAPANAAPPRASMARVHDLPAHVAIAFDRGVPVAINGVPMELVELLESVTTIAAGQGIGRIDRRPRPSTERTICEAPAATVLHAAHQALESRVANPQAHLTGVVSLLLSDGACTVEKAEI